jgi:hypothetical protein
VLRVSFPDTPPQDTEPVTAPILDTWLSSAVEVSGRESTYGFVCLLTPRSTS